MAESQQHESTGVTPEMDDLNVDESQNTSDDILDTMLDSQASKYTEYLDIAPSGLKWTNPMMDKELLDYLVSLVPPKKRKIAREAVDLYMEGKG